MCSSSGGIIQVMAGQAAFSKMSSTGFNSVVLGDFLVIWEKTVWLWVAFLQYGLGSSNGSCGGRRKE